MTATDFDRITVDPKQMNGQPCIRGTRLTVRRVVEAVSLYSNPEELFREYPELREDDVTQALEFAAANLEQPCCENKESEYWTDGPRLTAAELVSDASAQSSSA